MATIRIMCGDTYGVFMNLMVHQETITPEMVEDVEICVGDVMRKTYLDGGVGFDREENLWYIRPSQEETLEIRAGVYEVIARVKFKESDGFDVKGMKTGQIIIDSTYSREVI